MSDLPDLGSVPRGLEKRLSDLLEGMRAHIRALRGFDGRGEDIALSESDIRDIVANEVASLPASGGGSSGSTTYVPDYTEPPTPSGVTVVAGMSYVTTQTAAPTFTAGHGYDRTIVYGAQWPAGQATPPTFSDAVPVDEFVGDIGSFPTKMATRWCIWVKWRTKDGIVSTTAAGGANGFQVTTGQDVALLLQVLSQQITNSQLATSLATQINLISAPSSTAGSVAAQVKAETDARVAAVAQEVTDRNTAISTSVAAGVTSAVNSAKTYTESWAYSKAQADSAISVSSASVRTDFATADTATLNSANTYTASYTYSRSAIDGAFNSLSSTLTASYQTADTATLNAAKSYADASVSSYAYSKAQADAAIASSVNTVNARLNTGGDVATAISAAALAATNAQATADGKASASSVTTLQAQVAGTQGSALKSAIEQEAEVRAEQTGQLYAKIGFKLDVNGYVTGWAQNNNGTSGGIVFLQDSFAIGAPGVASRFPVVIRTTVTYENGVAIQPGAYFDSASMVNVSALWGRFGTLVADTVQAASLSAAQLTVGDGTVGGNLKSASYVPGTSGWLLNSAGSFYAYNGSIGGVTISGAALRSGQTAFDTGAGFWLGGDGKFSVGSGSTNKLSFDGANFTLKVPGLTIEGGSASFSGSIAAGTTINAGVSLNAPSGTLGTITAGLLRSSSNASTYLNLGATGSDTFLSVYDAANGRTTVSIKANGSVSFYKLLASGTKDWGSGQVGTQVFSRTGLLWTLTDFDSGRVATVENVEFPPGSAVYDALGGNSSQRKQIVGGYCYIDTGISVPYSAIYSQTLVARARLLRTYYTAESGGVSSGQMIGKFEIAADIVLHQYQYKDFYPGNAEQQNIWIRVWVKPFASGYGSGVTGIWVNAIEWALDFVP